MTEVPKKKLTYEEYFALDQADPWKNELCDGEMRPMDHPSRQHLEIMSYLVYGVGMSLRDTPYCSLSSRMRVFFPATDLYTFPDMLIVPRPVQCTDKSEETAINPQVLIEVLTATSEARDRRTVYRHYMKAESVREIVLIADNEPRIEQYTRTQDGGWNFTLHSDLSESLTLHTVRVELPLAAIYRDIDFPASPIIVERGN